MISDNLAASSLPASEHFTTIDRAPFSEILRAVSFTPGTDVNRLADNHGHDHGFGGLASAASKNTPTLTDDLGLVLQTAGRRR